MERDRCPGPGHRGVSIGIGCRRGFCFDSAIEIGASLVVVWALTGTHKSRETIALRLIGTAFLLVAVYVTGQAAVTLIGNHHPQHSPLAIAWTAATCVVMLALARGKATTGQALGNPVLQTEGRVNLIDACLAAAVLIGLTLNTVLGW
jgi:divalent metal cation (Fe/Co/Zn/Cd) transporter